MKVKKILLFLVSLCFSIPSWSMEKPEDGRRRSIELPSDHEKTGLTARVFTHPEQYKSWLDLEYFTTQTLRNFETENKHGLFFIHSLEDIMGAAICFFKKWNETYLADQRMMKEDGSNFYDVFTHQEFVDHYIQFVLAERFLISGSIVAYCDINKLNLTATFSPVSFVMVVPPECIGVTERHDAGTSTDYFPNVTSVEITKHGYNSMLKKDCVTSLDFLVRFPEIHNTNEDNEGCAYKMNEVAVAGCAVSGNNVYKPSVVAVLYNKEQKNAEFDYGNAARNKYLVQAAENFAKKMNLPFIVSDTYHGVSKNEMSELANEWFETTQDNPGNLTPYTLFFEHFNDGADRQLLKEFREHVVCEAMSTLNLGDKKTWDEMLISDVEEEQQLATKTQREIAQKIRNEEPRFQEALKRKDFLKHKMKTFLLADNELQYYGLKRPDQK